MSEINKSFSCVLCETKLDSKEALQEHFRKHANKSIDCKGTTAKTTKAKEPSLDLKEKITCDVCPMEFDTVTKAIQHKFKKHPDNSTKHYCPFCGMQFPLKFTKEKHVKIHKGMSTIGEFPCSECGIIFHNSPAQNYHFKSTHKRIMSFFKPITTPPPSKKIKINNAHEAQSVYYCYLCGMEYVIKFNLQKHLEISHNEEERNKVPENLIKCTTCDALFYTKKAYDNHNMYHKPDDLYVASEEQRLQTVSRVDQDFDIRRVQLAADKFIPIDKPKRRRQCPPPKLILSLPDKNAMGNNTSNSDDELSPTSSIDTSDSENETLITIQRNAKSKNKIIKAKSKKESTTNSSKKKNTNIPGNSKQNEEVTVVKKIVNPDIFLNLPTSSSETVATKQELINAVNQIINEETSVEKIKKPKLKRRAAQTKKVQKRVLKRNVTK